MYLMILKEVVSTNEKAENIIYMKFYTSHG